MGSSINRRSSADPLRATNGKPRPPVLECAPSRNRVDIKVRDGIHNLLETNEIKTWPGAGFERSAGSQTACQNDRGDAWNVRPVDLPCDHEDADGFWITVMAFSTQEHVEPAFVGSEPIEDE